MKKNKFYLLSLIFISLFSSCHLVRSVIFLRPDHHDDRKFPKNILASADELFSFSYTPEQLEPEKLSVTYRNGEQTNLLQLLDNSMTSALLIVKDGSILFEKYYNKYDNEKTHGSFSVSKGMLASM
ncbi:MAG: hypothetical protein R2772_11625, partial [Chitinophagales bacterium]